MDDGAEVQLERTFEADVDRVFRATAGHTNRWDGQQEESLVTLRLTSVLAVAHLELIHPRLPAGADPHEYRQGLDAARASLTRHLLEEGNYADISRCA